MRPTVARLFAAWLMFTGCSGQIDETQPGAGGPALPGGEGPSGVRNPGGVVANPAFPAGATPDKPGAATDLAPGRPVTTTPTACVPGRRPTLRRLNAREYTNSLRALLGPVAIDARSLPDDVENSKNFDTDGASLLLGETDANKYYLAADSAIEEAFAKGPPALIPCRLETGASCVKTSLAGFLRKAFRRPVAPEQLAPFEALAATEADPTTGLKKALLATLLSPNFLYARLGDVGTAAGSPYALGPHELAERLSLFLWSSLPDETLQKSADDGRLSQPDVLRAEVRRMVTDPRAEQFINGFVSGWLTLDKVQGLVRTARRFPEFSQALLQSMEKETKTFVRSFLTNGRPVRDLLLATNAFMNESLAKIYGVSGISGTDLKETEGPAGRRRGLLTQASLLSLTGTDLATVDTSLPIHRGVFIARRILCMEPPPPPPNVPPPPNKGVTLKERLSQHKSSPSCAGCHAVMDPLGVGMEPYDGLGRWRTTYGTGGPPVEATESWRGRAFNGPMELIEMLGATDDFPVCLTEHLVSYAVGRLTDAADGCQVKQVATSLGQGKGSLVDLIEGLVTSDLFRRHLAVGQ